MPLKYVALSLNGAYREHVLADSMKHRMFRMLRYVYFFAPRRSRLLLCGSLSTVSTVISYVAVFATRLWRSTALTYLGIMLVDSYVRTDLGLRACSGDTACRDTAGKLVQLLIPCLGRAACIRVLRREGQLTVL